MAVFGVFALGVAFYAASRMRQIDSGYSGLMTGNVTAAVILMGGRRGFITNMGKAATLTPEHVAEIALLKSSGLYVPPGKFTAIPCQAKASAGAEDWDEF